MPFGRTPAVIGFDTSNYRTSVAVVTLDGAILADHRELLPVSRGERGLRQSDAVFTHIRQLRQAEELLRSKADEIQIVACAASVSPRDGAESYMPVFQVGHTAAVLLSAALNVPFFATTHQRGHLAAARQGTCLEREDCFLALHLSGGTTDLLLAQSDTIQRLGGSADLHAGQLVDRVGVALGLSFPAGPGLEALALSGSGGGKLGCSLEQGDLVCHLSGAETRALRWIQEGTCLREEVAYEIYDLLARTLIRMLKAGAEKTGIDKALITGGVASSGLLRSMMEDRKKKLRGCPELIFGKPEHSGDNAVGVALIGAARVQNRE